MAELRSFIFIDQLQPRTMCYLGTWIRGSLPRSNMAAQIIEVAPWPRHRAADRRGAEARGGAERHPRGRAAVWLSRDPLALDRGRARRRRRRAGRARHLRRQGNEAPGLASKIVTRIDHQHAFLINRNKLGSMILQGESLFVLEMQPAAYAILATNEAEKAADIKVVDYRMMGATGRVYLSGTESDIRAAAQAAEQALGNLQ
jgi:hypothetical protein